MQQAVSAWQNQLLELLAGRATKWKDNYAGAMDGLRVAIHAGTNSFMHCGRVP